MWSGSSARYAPSGVSGPSAASRLTSTRMAERTSPGGADHHAVTQSRHAECVGEPVHRDALNGVDLGRNQRVPARIEPKNDAPGLWTVRPHVEREQHHALRVGGIHAKGGREVLAELASQLPLVAEDVAERADEVLA